MDELELRAARVALKGLQHNRVCQNPLAHIDAFSQVMYSYGKALEVIGALVMEIEQLCSGQSRVYVEDLESAIKEHIPDYIQAALGPE